MPQLMPLTGHPFRLDFIYNVSQAVGPGQPNNALDVELVQFLLSEVLKKPHGNRRISSPLPTVTRSFDLATGFWIYEFQHNMKSQATIDGVISPAQGNTISYAAGKFWTIGNLNFGLHEQDPDTFNNMSEDPRLTPALRAAISE